MKKIYAICRTHNAGYDCEQEYIQNCGIKVGDKIELENALVHGWCTDINLIGFDKSFNSVFFNFIDENGEEYNIYSDSRFQTYF